MSYVTINIAGDGAKERPTMTLNKYLICPSALEEFCSASKSFDLNVS